MGLEIEIPISVSLFPVYSRRKGAVRMVGDLSIEEGELSFLLRLDCELYGGLDGVEMAVEGWELVRRNGSAGIIDISFPKPGWGWEG